MSKFRKEADRIAAEVQIEKFEKMARECGIDCALNELNAVWRREMRGGKPDDRRSFNKRSVSKEEQAKIDRELKKFVDLLEAGGIDQALLMLNEQWRKETRAKPRALYG